MAMDSVRGRRATFIVLAVAADGYRAVFSLAEITPGLGEREVIIADSRNNSPLEDVEGPFRLVVPADKRQTRWIRQLTSINVFPAREPATLSAETSADSSRKQH
jgi:hypothetical protein